MSAPASRVPVDAANAASPALPRLRGIEDRIERRQEHADFGESHRRAAISACPATAPAAWAAGTTWTAEPGAQPCATGFDLLNRLPAASRSAWPTIATIRARTALAARSRNNQVILRFGNALVHLRIEDDQRDRRAARLSSCSFWSAAATTAASTARSAFEVL